MKPYVPSDESMSLRELLETDDELTRLETLHPGAIRILSVQRVICRILVFGKDAVTLRSTARAKGQSLEMLAPRDSQVLYTADLGKLIKHRAAEAMLAVRQGHREYVSKRKNMHIQDRDA